MIETNMPSFHWQYEQATGRLSCDGAYVAYGYSGAMPSGRNNPAAEKLHNIGPIPRGRWQIGDPHDSATHGPFVLQLTPALETETYGRRGFLIHGDSKEHPGQASEGCIIMPRAVRNQIWNSGATEIEVV